MIRVLSLVLLAWCAQPSLAQSPASAAPLRIVVPTPAGGPLDGLARVLATAIGRATQEQVLVDNRPGAAGLIGTDHVAKAVPDGRTLLMASTFVPLNTVLFKAPYDAVRDFAPVIELTRASQVLLVRQGLEARHPAGLARAAAQRHGGLNCAAAPGDGQLACEQLKQLLGGASVTVPYPGMAQAGHALTTGQVDFFIATHDLAVSLVDTGRAVAIASTGTRRSLPPFDKLPLAHETWPSFRVDGFVGILAPAGTPADALQRLHRLFARALDEPAVREFMAARGSEVPDDRSPERLAVQIRERVAHYRQLVAQLGLKPEGGSP